jgi:hypothetical protein
MSPSVRPHRTVMVAISAHGFGHAAQVAPVINRLRAMRPETRFVTVSDLPAERLADWIDAAFTHERLATDPGIRMRDPLSVDVEATAVAYRAFDRTSDALFDRLCSLVRQHEVDLVVADVPWLPLAAARASGRTAAALCSLNWVDIVVPLLGSASGLDGLFERMRDAYRAADLFIQPAPAMPMDWLANRRPVGHIARVGQPAADRIRQHLGLPAGQRLALVQFGGERGGIPLRLPETPGLTWLMAGQIDAQTQAAGAQAICAALGLRFVDLVASMDLMLTKPGYGSFAEAVTNGVPLLSVSREAWPEEPWLLAWARERVGLREIDRACLAKGDFAPQIDELLDLPRAGGLPPDGVDGAAALLADLL